MDKRHSKASGKKKKKREQLGQKKHEQGSGAESLAMSAKSAGVVFSGETALDPDQNPESDSSDMVCSMLSDGNKNLEPHIRKETEIVMVDQARDAEKISLDRISSNRSSGSGSSAHREQESSNVNDDRGTLEVETDVAIPICPSDLTDNMDSSSNHEEAYGIKTIGDPSREQGKTRGNSSTVELDDYTANRLTHSSSFNQHVHKMLSREGNDVEVATSQLDAVHDAEEINFRFSKGAPEECVGAINNMNVLVGASLPPERPVNQEMASSELDQQQCGNGALQGARQVSKGKPLVVLSIADSQSQAVDSLHWSEEKNGGPIVEETFADALDQLTIAEGRNADVGQSRLEMEGNTIEKEWPLAELGACRDALMQANEEKVQLAYKLNHCQLQVEQIAEEKFRLELERQGAASIESCLKTDLDSSIRKLQEMQEHAPVVRVQQNVDREDALKNAQLLLEQEQLKQMLHDLEQEKMEMASAFEEFRTQLQAETKEKLFLSHELEIAQKKLHELMEERAVLTSHLEMTMAGMESARKQRGLVSDKLHISQPQVDNSTENRNQFVLDLGTLQQKSEELEAEKAAALSRMRELQPNVVLTDLRGVGEVELVKESQDSKLCLTFEVERFAKEAKDREEEYLQKIENLRNELQVLSNENQNLLTQLDEHARNMKEEEHQDQQLRNDLSKMRVVLDEMHEAKEQIARDFELYKLETSSAIVENEGYRTEAMEAREQADELRVQTCRLQVELHGIEEEKMKLMGDLNGCKEIVETLRNKEAELFKDLLLTRAELEQMKNGTELHKGVEKEKNQLAEENNKLSMELYECKGCLSRMHEEQLKRDNGYEDVVCELQNVRQENMNLVGSLHEFKQKLREVEEECLRSSYEAKETRDKSTLLQNQFELLQREYDERATSLEAERNDCTSAMLNAAEKLEETLQHVLCEYVCESDISNVDGRLATAVSASIQLVAKSRNLQEERDFAVRELFNTHNRLRKLVQQQERMNEDSEELLDRLRHVETKEGATGNTESVMALDILCDDCVKFVEQLQKELDEKSQFEATIRELESALFTKDQDIQDLNAKYVELSQKCEENQEVSVKCAVLDEICADMASQAVQHAIERDSLQSELDSLGKNLSEQEVLIKATSNAHSETIHHLETVTEKLIGAVEDVLQDETMITDSNMQKTSHLEKILLLLIEKYKASLSQLNLVQKCLVEHATEYGHSCEKEAGMSLDVALREVFSCTEKELGQLHKKLEEMDSIRTQQEEEMKELKDQLYKTEENLKEVNMEKSKIQMNLEQTEQKLISVREKLSLAVSKGKGLVQQRDALKQSLVDKSNELERCLQELQMKNAPVQEVDIKVAEHVKTLESQLADIQNSANALREMVLHKDSILQKIEEVLRQMNLPEVLLSKELIDKIEWLARSFCGTENAALSTSRDWRMSERNDTDIAVYKLSEASVDDNTTQDQRLEDLRRKYEELNDKYHSLIEQSVMLEQSLLERSDLIQRWEEFLDTVDMPTSVRSMDLEVRIEWLGRELTQARHDLAHSQDEIENAQRVANSSAIKLEESQRRINILEENLLKGQQEKELLVKSVEELSCQHESLTKQAAHATSQNECLHNELVGQQMKVLDHEYSLESDIANKSSVTEDCMRRLLGMVTETLKDQDLQELSSCCSSEYLEEYLRKLIDKFNALSDKVEMLKGTDSADTLSPSPSQSGDLQGLRDALETKEKEVQEMNRNLEEAFLTVASHRAEIGILKEQSRIMTEEVTTLKNKKDELQTQLEQTEEKSSLIREKLTMAVKKGKGLVQQRDSLKQSMEEKLGELEQLKAELQVRGTTIVEHEQRIRNLTSDLERFEFLESDIVSSKNHCAELEQLLLDSNNLIEKFTTCLDAIDITGGILFRDPVEKIECLGKSYHELQHKVDFAQHEAMKSKETADLLATELDEVHERVHFLEVELTHAKNSVSALMNEKKAAEAESDHQIKTLKGALVACTEELSEAHIIIDRQNTELLKQCTGFKHLQKEQSHLLSLLANDFSRKLDLLRSMELKFEDILHQFRTSKGLDLPGTEFLSEGSGTHMNLTKEGKYSANEAIAETYTEEHLDHLMDNSAPHRGKMVNDILSYLQHALVGCTGELELMRERFEGYSNAFNQEARILLQLLQNTGYEVVIVVESLESLKLNVANLEALNQDRDNEILMLHESISVVDNACSNSMEELQKLKVHSSSDSLSCGGEVTTAHSSGLSASEKPHALQSTGQVDLVKYTRTAENLLLAVRGIVHTETEKSKHNQRELRTLVSKLQQEAESREAEKFKVCGELESKLVKAEAAANNIARERELDKVRICELENYIESLENDRRALELSVEEFQIREASMKVMQEELMLLRDALTTKNQELEGLMQTKVQLENLYKKVEELENNNCQKQRALESLESSHGKTVDELSAKVSRFEELRQLSEGLVAEVENLHSQLESRNDEISRLKQEAMRSTSDMVASQENIDRKNVEIGELQMGLENMIMKFGAHDGLLEEKEESRTHALLHTLEDRIANMKSETEGFRVDAQNTDALLQSTQKTVEELLGRVQLLEASLRDKQTQLEIMQEGKVPELGANAAISEVSEIEELGQSSQNSAPSAPVAPHVRSTRKASSDHLTLNIDMDSDGSISDREDDDKGHVFKSLTTTGLIPKATRSLADRIDGIWVSGGRVLMRQPTARMGLIAYWIVLHLWMLATFV
eukprot:Gb_40009 [translate_table: standard]